jgi:hypothetical protein
VENKAWLLALFLPPWAQWPTIILTVLLGVALGAAGVSLLHKDRQPSAGHRLDEVAHHAGWTIGWPSGVTFAG